ncbi:hypothetical protein BSZ36_11125 [Rubricoccus marinus]|uniref:Uncharacterized protein n=2 Tax=Rubricoccus marinus TaxID=716817 RepID=A0A259U0D7_9BACT|nr:hypothetical protein BSZ36_11125 [Rubricoccus marinus]
MGASGVEETVPFDGGGCADGRGAGSGGTEETGRKGRASPVEPRRASGARGQNAPFRSRRERGAAHD